MKVKDVIKRLEKYNPEAVLRLGGSKGEEVLFICALAQDDKNVWLESASMCDLNEEIATERENYRNLIELGISAEDVKRVMGEDVYCEMMMTCVGGGLAKEMGREDLFDCTQKMNLF